MISSVVLAALFALSAKADPPFKSECFGTFTISAADTCQSAVDGSTITVTAIKTDVDTSCGPQEATYTTTTGCNDCGTTASDIIPCDGQYETTVYAFEPPVFGSACGPAYVSSYCGTTDDAPPEETTTEDVPPETETETVTETETTTETETETETETSTETNETTVTEVETTTKVEATTVTVTTGCLDGHCDDGCIVGDCPDQCHRCETSTYYSTVCTDKVDTTVYTYVHYITGTATSQSYVGYGTIDLISYGYATTSTGWSIMGALLAFFL